MSDDPFRDALIAGDVALIRRMWARARPDLPQPRSDGDTLLAMHVARTAEDTIPFPHRAWSHRWLLEHGYPSSLPVLFRPKAERLYPVLIEGVSVVIGTVSAVQRPLIKSAMRNAVLECCGDGERDVDVIKVRMQEARLRVLRG